MLFHHSRYRRNTVPQMKIAVTAMLAIIVVLLFGCISPQSAKTNFVYVCNDGTQVSDASLCRIGSTIATPTSTSITPLPNQTIPKKPMQPPANNATKPRNQKQAQNNSDDEGRGLAPTGKEIALPTSELNTQLAGTLLLGRPTNTSIDLSVLAVSGMVAYSEYGQASGVYTGKTDAATSSNSTPILLHMAGLKPDTEYYYRVEIRKPNETAFTPNAEHSFHTQRPAGEGFTFAVQADPHRDANTDENLYRATLRNELAANPDFLIDLGDTFMTEKFATSNDQVENRYIRDRGFFGIVSGSVPLFNVNGNHDGEFGWTQDGTSNNDAVWATMARKKYFLPPYPDSFYSGSNTSEPVVGVRGSYYAWGWGDALFVTLDPYWYTKTGPNSGNTWDWTLGDEQYHWLERTLENSHAKYKFIFEHHLIGDLRGSTFWAPYFEWGGENKDGSWGFSSERPGWDLTIRQLFEKTNVTIFFQGHDHLFVKEELDGTVYQTVPQPGNPHGDAAPGAEYNYHGVMLPSSGYMRVSVTSENMTVDYLKTAIGEQPEIAYNYTITK